MDYDHYIVSRAGTVHRVAMAIPWGVDGHKREVATMCVMWGVTFKVYPEEITKEIPSGRLCSICFSLRRKQAREVRLVQQGKED
jgi:hypothetical protein